MGSAWHFKSWRRGETQGTPRRCEPVTHKGYNPFHFLLQPVSWADTLFTSTPPQSEFHVRLCSRCWKEAEYQALEVHIKPSQSFWSFAAWKLFSKDLSPETDALSRSAELKLSSQLPFLIAGMQVLLLAETGVSCLLLLTWSSHLCFFARNWAVLVGQISLSPSPKTRILL